MCVFLLFDVTGNLQWFHVSWNYCCNVGQKMAEGADVIRDSVISAKFRGGRENMAEVVLRRVSAERVPESWDAVVFRRSTAGGYVAFTTTAHCNLLRINPAASSKWMPIAELLSRNVRKVLFATPQYPNESRWSDPFGTYGISGSLSWYSLMTLLIWCTIFLIIYHFV
jgi:hypothetical protein